MLILPYKIWWKPRFPMDQRPLVEGLIANFGISLDVFEVFAFWMIFPFFKKICFFGILGPLGNHASRWIRDLWLKGVSLILEYFQTFLSFCNLYDFFRFSKKSGFWVFFVQQNKVETMLPDGLETSGQRAYRKFCHISRRF